MSAPSPADFIHPQVFIVKYNLHYCIPEILTDRIKINLSTWSRNLDVWVCLNKGVGSNWCALWICCGTLENKAQAGVNL